MSYWCKIQILVQKIGNYKIKSNLIHLMDSKEHLINKKLTFLKDRNYLKLKVYKLNKEDLYKNLNKLIKPQVQIIKYRI